MLKTPASFRLASRVLTVLALMIVVLGAADAQPQSSVRGRVTWDTTTGAPNIPDARVHIMDQGSSPKAKRVFKSAAADDTTAEYGIDNVDEGQHDIVACDDLLKYKPQRKVIEVGRRGRTVDFKLERRDKAYPLQYQVGDSKIVYLKHIVTGCEFDAMRADKEGIVWIPNISSETTLYSLYAVCIDDGVEVSNTPKSPFESCVRKELRIGLPWDEVQAKLGPPTNPASPFHKHGGREVFIYRYVKIALQDGKVFDISVEIVPPACKAEKPCETN